MRKATRLATSVALASFAASCSGDSSGPGLVAVASVTVAPPAAEIGIGGTVPLQATVKDATDRVLVDRRVVWNTSDAEVATVSEAGVVTARRVGTAQVAASSGGKSAIAVVTVVPIPVASVSVLPPSAQVFVGSRVQLEAVAYDGGGARLAGRQITWSTSNGSVATVDAAGLVTGVAPGTATITAISEGKAGTATVTVSDVPVATVSVTPDPAAVVVGQTAQLTATARAASGTVLSGRPVTWSSSNNAIATVSSAGIVLGVAPGSVVITATVGGQSGTANVVVNAVPASAVLVSPATASLVVGGTTQLAATVTDAVGNPLAGRAVVWTTSNGAVASVGATGLVTALAPGTATITATSDGKTGTASITVAAVPVASVSVTPAAASVGVGQAVALSATVRGPGGEELAGRTVTWSTSNAGVATVSPTGVVTGITPGSVTITATSEGQVGTASISVTAGAPARLTVVSGDGQRSAAGTTLPIALVVRVTDASGNPVSGVTVTWTVASGAGSTSAPTSVTDASGLASVQWTLGPRSGQQSLTATVASLQPVTFTAQATGGSVASVIVSPSSLRVNALGSTMQLSAQAADRFQNAVPDAPFSWSSLNAGVATVDSRGLVTARSNGTARIVASAGGVADTATITVQQVVAAVSINPTSPSIPVGTTQQFAASVTDSNGIAVAGAQVAWSSSAPSVATVDQSGRALGATVGSTTISASAGGVVGRAQLQVTGAPVSRVEVNPRTLNLNVGETRRLTARTYDAAGNELRDRVITWSSSDPSVATVDASGNVQAKKVGTATITAAAEGKSETANVTVR